uniref:Uncharacterized protein n=1 Tax=viral metagenome TaxID=1070528 RepID=A0A6H2A0W2_9ZZZZ
MTRRNQYNHMPYHEVAGELGRFDRDDARIHLARRAMRRKKIKAKQSLSFVEWVEQVRINQSKARGR